MKLEYNILWFEDRKEYVDAYKERIVDYLEDLGGFALNLKDQRTGDNLDKLLKDYDFDLILVDLNLNPDEMGNKAGSSLVDRIRQHEIYTEIVFYGVTRSAAMKSLKAQVDGVYFTGRSKFFEKTRKIIRLTLEKNLHIVNTRGLFIAETIDLVEQLEEIISKILKLQKKVWGFFKDQIIQEDFFTDIAKYKVVRRFLKLKIKSLEKDIQSSTGKRKNELNSLKSKIEGIVAIFKKFHPEVIELRNQLAHAKRQIGKKNTLLVRDKDKGSFKEVVFNEMKCKKIRKDFLKHSENLREILSLFEKRLL